jgi:hypothetical protein
MEVAGWGGRLLWGFVYSEGDCWRDWGEEQLRRLIHLRCIGTATKLCYNGRSFRLDSTASEGADCVKAC